MLSHFAPQAYTYRDAMAITGVSLRQIQYWELLGLVSPSVQPAEGRGTRRLYSFRDLVALKLVKSFRDAGLPLQRIRKAVVQLRTGKYQNTDLGAYHLVTDGCTVDLVDYGNGTKIIDLLAGGQVLLCVTLEDIRAALERRLARARHGRRGGAHAACVSPSASAKHR